LSFSCSFSLCLVGSNPPHLIKSNVINNNIAYCRPEKYCQETNRTALCPLYASVCNRTNNDLCDKDQIKNVRIESGVPGLKNWQLGCNNNNDKSKKKWNWVEFI